MIYDVTSTVEQALAAWDADDVVWTVEMGGMGPGYEMAIQILVIGLLRDHKDKPLPMTEQERETWGDDTVHRLNEDCLGFSGAQVGAAKWLAHLILKEGYGAALIGQRDKDPERLTMISRSMPRTTNA